MVALALILVLFLVLMVKKERDGSPLFAQLTAAPAAAAMGGHGVDGAKAAAAVPRQA